ncbi:MAG: heavy metal translocating P-type ATPase [Microthrixaceae bacterium]
MPHDLQIDLDIVLPEAHGLHDRCVEELLAVLDATDGIGDAHIHPATGESPAQLCLSVERGGLSLARLNDRARSAGAQISKRYGHVLWQLQGITHSTRARNASAEIRRLPGVLDAEVATGGAARIEFDRLLTNEKDLAEAVEDAGLALDLVTVARAHARQRDSGDHGREVGRHDLGSHDISQHDHNQGDHNQDGHDHDGHDHEERDGHDHGDGRSHSHDHAGHSHNSNVELAVSAVAFVVFMVARILDWVTDLDLPVTLAYVATATVTGFMVGRDVLSTLMARRFDIEMLMLAAAAGAAALGDWSDAALLLVLFSLGHGLEGFAMSRARREIESLGELAPTTAHLLDRDGSILEVAVADVRVGDILVVRPNDRISADGIVVKGTTTVDESPVTGESTPADKAPAPEFRDSDPTELNLNTVRRDNTVFSGTLNGPSAIEVRVARTAEDSTLARVVRMVAEAETQVSPTQRLTQRIVRIFVPSVLVLVTLLLAVPLLFGAEFRPTFLRAMAVLVASSPCALAIATPSAVLAGIARSARDGVLVKGGGPLETLGQVCTMAFDKTGTLTEGRPRLVAVEPCPGVTVEELLSIAVAVEAQSDHPIARAVTSGAAEFADDLPQLTATDVRAEIGRGVTATLDGSLILIGSRSLASVSPTVESSEGDPPAALVAPALETTLNRLESSGATTMIVSRDGTTLGVLGVMDTPRAEAAATIEALVGLGIHSTVMLSGDHQAVADAVASQVGITEARGGLLPEDKVTAIRELATQHRRGVAMVGDGVNDAPALASSSVGIAMGAAGSAVALETADIALMSDRLDRLPFAVHLARRSSGVIRQNLFISLGMVAVLIPLTIAGIGIGPAVIAHEGSTLVVVANALRLLAHKGLTPPTRDAPPH